MGFVKVWLKSLFVTRAFRPLGLWDIVLGVALRAVLRVPLGRWVFGVKF